MDDLANLSGMLTYKKINNAWKEISDIGYKADINSIQKAANNPGSIIRNQGISYYGCNDTQVYVYYELEARYELRDQYIMSLMHELKNYINIVTSFSYLESRKQPENHAFDVINRTSPDIIKNLEKLTDIIKKPISSMPAETHNLLVLTSGTKPLLIECLQSKPDLNIVVVNNVQDTIHALKTGQYGTLLIDHNVILKPKQLNVSKIIVLIDTESSVKKNNKVNYLPKDATIDHIYNMIISSVHEPILSLDST